MKNSKTYSMEPLIFKKKAIAMVVLGIIGFIDATYLTIEHYLGRLAPCSIVKGCEKVLTSQYADVAGFPTALFGALYYLTVVILLLLYFDTKNARVIRGVSLLTALGFLFSLYLLFLQIFVLKAICLYCLLSAAASISLFGIGLVVMGSRLKRPVY